MKRRDIMNAIENSSITEEAMNEIRPELTSFIDNVEGSVNRALDFLSKINNVDGLDKVAECRDELQVLSEDLH